MAIKKHKRWRGVQDIYALKPAPVLAFYKMYIDTRTTASGDRHIFSR